MSLFSSVTFMVYVPDAIVVSQENEDAIADAFYEAEKLLFRRIKEIDVSYTMTSDGD